tara:strand:- start:73 stop:483 length:411 start_codon:yes stop_codon:yes gene_type:complete
MDIEKQTKQTMSDAINNFALEYEKEIKNVQLMIKCDDEFTPKYELLINNKKEKDITFNEVLNVKIDFLGREMIVAPFITNTLKKLRKETNCSPNEMNILIYKKDDTEKVYLYFFVETKPIKPISFDFIFEELSLLN